MIKNIEFVKSAVKLEGTPSEKFLDVVFVGRSNVGKSSLINSLCGRKKIAHVSKTPGRTRCMNFFSVGDLYYLVDLPGYGFAEVPLSVKNEWKKMIESYLKSTRRKILFILVDSRREEGAEDNQLIKWCKTFGIEHYLVFTKTDKIKRNELREKKKKINALFTSSKEKEGLETIMKIIEISLNERIKELKG